jgi:hypothetical protein
MTRPMIREYDFSTGEDILREMNDSEYETYLADQIVNENPTV